MNQTLYKKIKQTIEEKDCLFQIDENKKSSIIHNISAYVTEMLERECKIKLNNVEYSFTSFVIHTSQELFQWFVDDYNRQHCGRNELTYYNQHKEYWSNLLNEELNKQIKL